jgi:hypothetical protein
MDYETAPMFEVSERCYCPSDCNCRHADIGRTNYCGCRNHLPADQGPTLADVVEAIAARRDLTRGGQISLPDEFMPTPAGRLFA